MGFKRLEICEYSNFSKCLRWPKRLFVAVENGIYYTNNFTDPTNQSQPTWSSVHEGLGVTTIQTIDVDPFNRAGRQVCLTSTEETVYIRTNNGPWNPLITQADVSSITQDNVHLQQVIFDKVRQNRLWILAHKLNDLYGGIYMLYSDDGIAWYSKWVYEGLTRQANNIYTFGDTLWLAYSSGAGGAAKVGYSADFGLTWVRTASLGDSSWPNYIIVSPTGEGYSTGNGIGGPDLVHILKTGQVVICQNPLDLGATYTTRNTQTQWFSEATPGYQRILSANKLYTTFDDWETVVNSYPSELSEGSNFNVVLAPLKNKEDWMILGAISRDFNQEHLIYTLNSDAGIPRGKSGVDPNGGLDSIPISAGNLVLEGIKIIG